MEAGNAALSAAGARVKLTDDARASLLHARVGVVASGTATVEAALIGTPFVMVYRVAPLTWALGRHLVKLPHYGMVNLVAGREVVPELIQDDFTPERVEREVRALLEDGAARRKMTEALAEVRGLLRGLPREETAAPSAGRPQARCGRPLRGGRPRRYCALRKRRCGNRNRRACAESARHLLYHFLHQLD